MVFFEATTTFSLHQLLPLSFASEVSTRDLISKRIEEASGVTVAQTTFWNP